MTLQQLRYVIAVADHGSMNEAAKMKIKIKYSTVSFKNNILPLPI